MRNILKLLSLSTFIILTIFLISCGPKTMDKARNYVEVKMYEEAIPLLEMEVQEHPKNAEAHFLLGKSYLHTNEEEKAEISFGRAIKAKPNFKSHVTNEYKELGIKLLGEGKFERAKEIFDQAVNYDSVVREEIAEILIKRGKEISESDIEGSLWCFREAIQCSESHKNDVGTLCLSIAENLLDKEKIDESQFFADLAKEAFGEKFEKEGQNYLKKLSGLVEPVRAIGEIKQPKLVKRVEPIYPEIARRARVEGTVILEVTTDIYGRVQNIKLLRSVPILDQAAIDAVRQWVYEPMIIDGYPRGVIFTVTVNFKLPVQKERGILDIEKEKQEETMLIIGNLADAVLRYIDDNGKAPSYEGKLSESCRIYSLLTPFYVKNLPINDEWGNALYVKLGKPQKNDFLIISCGRDGIMEINPVSEFYICTKLSDFNKDIIMKNGNFIRAPKLR